MLAKTWPSRLKGIGYYLTTSCVRITSSTLVEYAHFGGCRYDGRSSSSFSMLHINKLLKYFCLIVCAVKPFEVFYYNCYDNRGEEGTACRHIISRLGSYRNWNRQCKVARNKGFDQVITKSVDEDSANYSFYAVFK